MKRLSPLALALLLAACTEGAENRTKDVADPMEEARQLESGPLSEDQVNLIRSISPGMTPLCVARLRSEGLVGAGNMLVDQCFEMTAPQRWRGLWRNYFEGSRFCPMPAEGCSDETPGQKIWLAFPDGGEPVGREEFGGLYEVEFVGRRTLYPSHFGHFGMSDHEMIVDRLISIRMIEPPTPPMTQAEIEEGTRRCRASPDCVPAEDLERELR